MKRFEILEGLPAYGPMYFPVTETGEPYYSEGFVVRFFKPDGTDWVANFQPGHSELSSVLELKKCPHILVIAMGICYLMEVENPKPVMVFGSSYSNLISTENNLFILQAHNNLTIIEPNGTIWETERISWDRLRNIKCKNNLISGQAFAPINDTNEWVDFTYDLENQKLNGGSFHRYNDKKPWWKFWG